MKRLWCASAAAVGLCVGARGEEPVLPAAARECLPPVILPYCPPGPGRPVAPLRPIEPTRPSTSPAAPSEPSTPSTPPAAPTTPATDPLARAPEGGALSAATFNPNMYGDTFAGSTVGFTLTTSRNLTFVLSGLVPPGRVPSQPIPYRPANFQAPTDTLLPSPGSVVFLQDNGGVVSFLAPPFQTVAPFSAFPTPQTLPLRENATVTNGLRTLNPGAAVLFLAGGSHADLVDSESLIYFLTQAYRIDTTQVAALFVPFPGGGGVVGRTKIADDNSPMPRDRLIMNADYFGNTILTPNGFDVTRFSPGFEYTFCDRWASIEARFPFASTLDNAIDAGGLTNRAAEFGNVNLTLKALLMRGREINVAAGVGVSLPTGPDSIVRGPGGSDLLRINNESYIVTPYVAALFTPDERVFAQAWVQLGFDTTGSPVRFNPGGTGLVDVGRLHDQTLLSTDLQLGYWLVRNECSPGLRGLAPFVELHYNTPVNDAGLIRTGGLTIGSLTNRYDEVNLTVGLAALFGDNLLVSAGFVTPLRPAPDRSFDYQFGLRANWLFGPPVPMGGLGAAPAGGPADVMTGTPGGAMPPGEVPAPGVDPLARGPEAGALAAGTFNPNFFGDLLGGAQGRRQLSSLPTTNPRMTRIPVLPRYVGLKPVENDGPRPTDRVFFSYNHYAGVNSSVNPPGSPEVWLDRQIVGLETTLGPDASVGVRLPFLQSGGAPAFEAREVGDLSIVGKYALVNDSAGNVITVGAVLTLPTGGRGDTLAVLDDGTVAPRSLFFQPWAGAVLTNGDWFAQGITSVVMPADPVYPTTWFNSLGVGYWLYRNRADGLVQGVTPVVELHANTPLTNRGDDAPIFFRDQLNLTTGLYVQFPRLAVGAAVCYPLVNPKPYDVEVMLSVNYQF